MLLTPRGALQRGTTPACLPRIYVHFAFRSRAIAARARTFCSLRAALDRMALRRQRKVQLLGLLGFAIALYALSVEANLDDPTYIAACDFGASFSCTAVFKSPYAHVLSHWGLVERGGALDLSLAVAGMALYSCYFLAGGPLWSVMPVRAAIFLAVALAGAAFSCYLLYVLKFVLRDFCIVCTGFHAVNFSMLVLAIGEARDARRSSSAGAKDL